MRHKGAGMDKCGGKAIAEVTEALRLKWLVDAEEAHGLQGTKLYGPMSPAVTAGLSEELRERLVASIVKHCVSKEVREEMAAAWAGQAINEALGPMAVPQDPVHGDVLPALGARVWIRHGRDDDAHACTVVGYYVWPSLSNEKNSHRVFVRVVYEGTTTGNARLLSECWATREEALAHGAEQAPA